MRYPVYGAPPMAGSDKDKKQRTSRSISLNKKVRHEFEILDTFEAGIVLVGTEVKTLRVGQVKRIVSFINPAACQPAVRGQLGKK